MGSYCGGERAPIVGEYPDVLSKLGRDFLDRQSLPTAARSRSAGYFLSCPSRGLARRIFGIVSLRRRPSVGHSLHSPRG